MEKCDEKRAFERHQCNLTMACGFFPQRCSLNARLANFSEGGINFRSRYPMKHGSTVIVRVMFLPGECSGRVSRAMPRTTSLAEVKWCREIPDALEVPYEIGAKFWAFE